MRATITNGIHSHQKHFTSFEPRRTAKITFRLCDKVKPTNTYDVCYLDDEAGDRRPHQTKTEEQQQQKQQKPCIIFILKPSNGARNNEYTHQKQEVKNIIDVVCDSLRVVHANVRLNYFVLVFIGAFDMMSGNSSSFDFYCKHIAHTQTSQSDVSI